MCWRFSFFSTKRKLFSDILLTLNLYCFKLGKSGKWLCEIMHNGLCIGCALMETGYALMQNICVCVSPFLLLLKQMYVQTSRHMHTKASSWPLQYVVPTGAITGAEAQASR